MSTTAMPTKISEPPKSLGARLVGVFFSPGKTFADIARKPDFVVPLIVLALASITVTETKLAKIGIERTVRQQIEHSSRASTLTPEQIQQAVENAARIGTIIAYASPLGIPVVMLLIASFGMLISSVRFLPFHVYSTRLGEWETDWGKTGIAFGPAVPFKTAFSVASYAGLVTVLGSLMTVVIIFFGDPEHFNPQSPIPTNPGFFLSSDTPKPLAALAGSLDILTFWFMGLLAVGFSAATARLPMGKLQVFWGEMSHHDVQDLASKPKVTAFFLAFSGVWAVLTLIGMTLARLGWRRQPGGLGTRSADTSRLSRPIKWRAS